MGNVLVLGGEPHRCDDRKERVASSLTCPACKMADLDITAYESMMVLRPDLALFTLQCPLCRDRVSTLQTIPTTLQDDVRHAADAVGAGMGAE